MTIHTVSIASQSYRSRWLSAASMLALGLLSLGIIFDREVSAAIPVWMSPTYNHCLLVVPVAAYLTWQRRMLFSTYQPEPTLWIALVAIPVALCWFLAERIGIMEGRQLLAMTLVQILFLVVLGLRTWKAFCTPLLYLFFLVPFGEFLTPKLQLFTAHFVTAGLDLLGIVNLADGITIQIPEGSFYIAEACAGMRFFIASVAFGVFYACIMYRSPLRRTGFVLASIIVPIVANGLRALGIIVIAHLIGNAQAAATDHVLYGWLFFSFVIFLLILVGFPFRQEFFRVNDLRAIIPGGSMRAGAVATAAIVFFSAIPQVFANILEQHSGRESVVGIRYSPPTGCMTTALPSWVAATTKPRGNVGTVVSEAHLCGDDTFVLTLETYPARIAARPVYTSLRNDVGDFWGEPIITRTEEFGRGAFAQSWSETEYSHAPLHSIVASALWVNGKPSEGIKGRINQALNVFRGSAGSPVVARIMYVTSRPPEEARHSFQAYLSKSISLSIAISRDLDPNARNVQ